MIPIKKNKFSIDDKLIIIETGLQNRMLLIVIGILFTILPLFLLPILSIGFIDLLILLKFNYISTAVGFVLFWFLTDVKIIFDANSKKITKKISVIRIYTIGFELIKDVSPITENHLIYYGMVFKKDPLGKSKQISPKYAETKFDKKQLDEFEQRILPKIKEMINNKIN